MVSYEERKNIETMQEVLSRQLSGYARSMRELSQGLYSTYRPAGQDRLLDLEQYKEWESRQMFGTNMDEISRLIFRLAKSIGDYIPMSLNRKKKITHALKAEGISLRGAFYLPAAEGRQALALTLSTTKKNGIRGEYVAEFLSVLLDQRLCLSMDSPYRVECKEQVFIFTDKPRYTVLTGFARVCRDDEKISGDNYSFWQNDCGKLSLLLSDGTGSGEKACEESGYVVDYMERMIGAGFDSREALSFVNMAVCMSSNQLNHPTLDLCTLDLYEGVGEFLKVGGVDSFVKSKDLLLSVAGGNLPLGIYERPECAKERVSVKDGEYVIMMTDGVLEALGRQEGSDGVQKHLLAIQSVNPAEIASLILRRAIFASEGHIQDDMTVLVAGMFEM